MRVPLVACREPSGKLRQPHKVLYIFKQKTQYFLSDAPFTHIVVFWHIKNMPPPLDFV